MLVGPLNQFPNTSSAIYQQAILRNVTLLSYAHLNFMVKFNTSKVDCRELWSIGKTLEQQLSQNSQSELDSAENYWKAIDETALRVFMKKKQDLDKVKESDQHHTRELGNEGIQYWETKIEEYRHLSKEEAIRRLIKAEKIEAKIEQIKKAIAWEAVQ